MTINRLLKSQKPFLQCSHVLKDFQRGRLAAPISVDHLNDKYQYLTKGQIPMLHFQRSLPRLAIPKLEVTIQRYLAAVEPLYSDKAVFDKMAIEAQQFASTGNGPTLQKLLIAHDKANRHTSYISEPWFDMYLKDRKPLPINYNPVLIMKPDEKNGNEYNNQLTRTANLVVSSLRFMRALNEQLLEPEVYHMNPKKSDTPKFRKILSRTPGAIATFVAYAFKAFPLDMSQYEGLFGATRIPEVGKDRISRTTDSTHICVMKNGHIYAVNVLDNSGNIESPSAIVKRLKYVYNSPECQKVAEHPIGILTTENRDVWAKARQHLCDTFNKTSLELIDSALFCVSLDEEAPYGTNPLEKPEPIVQNFLHGINNSIKNRFEFHRKWQCSL